ncbi:MAG TPA: zf-HC2 domain-containing protein [Polyangia bacterium]|jgi:hypothetical protein
MKVVTDECERLLEFAYDELAGDAAERFRAHLAGCAKCQSELDGIRRVRGAAKAALPAIEPPEASSGALHAQLLHAAAQRRPAPPRGKLLAFARKVSQHPAYAAAAMFLLVGGAVGIEWSRGQLFMAEPAQPKVASSPSAAAEAAPIVPAPAEGFAQNGTPGDQPASAQIGGRAGAPSGETDLELAKKGAVEQQTRLYLGTKSGERPMEVRAAPAHHAASGHFEKAKDKANANASNALADDRQQLAAPVTRAPRRESASDGLVGGDIGWNAQSAPAATGAGGSAPSSPYATAPAAAPAPPPAPAAEPAPAADRELQTATVSDGKLARGGGETLKNERSAVAVPKAAAPRGPSTPEALRKRADELANANRCEEAVKLFEELERSYPRFRIAPRDRLPYVRCLRTTGRQADALDELNAAEPERARKRQAAPQKAHEAHTVAPAKSSPAEEQATAKKKSAKPEAKPEPAKADAPSR